MILTQICNRLKEEYKRVIKRIQLQLHNDYAYVDQKIQVIHMKELSYNKKSAKSQSILVTSGKGGVGKTNDSCQSCYFYGDAGLSNVCC